MILIVIATLFALLSAKLESIIWHIHTLYASVYESVSKQIHKLLLLLRCFVSALLIPFFDNSYIVISCIGLFFYVHQSALYMYRNEINKNVYQDGWFSDGSASSESFLDRKFPFNKKHSFRFAIFLISIFLIFLGFKR
jgi:hypothetical protein